MKNNTTEMNELNSLRQRVAELEQQLAKQISDEVIIQIEQAKQDWETTVDVLPQLICLLDEQKCVVRANRTIEKWKLSTVVGIKGKEIHHLLHPDCNSMACYLKTFLTNAWPRLAQGESAEYEIADTILGRHLQLEIRPILPRPLASEVVTLPNSFAALVVHDITERKQFERVLQWEQLRNEIIIDRAQDGFIIMDLEGRFGEVNQAYCKMVGYEYEELVGRFMSDLDVHETAETMVARLSRVTQTGADQFETKHRTKDGSVIDLGVHINYVEFGSDELLYTFVRNITERKQLEEQLREYSDHLEQNVVDRTRRLEFIAMLSGHLNSILDLHQLLAELVNKLKQSFGFYHADVYLIEEETGDLVIVEGAGEVGQQLKKQGHRLSAEQGIVGKVATSNRYFLSNNVAQTDIFFANPLLPDTKSELAVPLHKGEHVMGVLDVQSEQVNFFTVEDVSLMESIADQTAIALDNVRLLADRQTTIFKLQELDRLKSEFLTSMSHELRTPLNAILGFSDLLLEGIDGDLSPEAHNDIQLIYSSGQHLLIMVNDILDISKIEADMMELVPEFLEVPEMIEDVLSVAESLVSNKPVKIITQLPESLPLVYADKTRLKQVLINLVNNAIKFTSKGQITIKVELGEMLPLAIYHQQLPASNGQPVAAVRFTVIDTGVGIPFEKQETIFERFKQGDMSKTREYGGTGLGLAISKQLVEMHGGKIEVKSQVGVGSEFYFSIPVLKKLEI